MAITINHKDLANLGYKKDTDDPKSEEWIIVGGPNCDWNEIKTKDSLTDVLNSSEYLNVSFEILEYIVNLHNDSLNKRKKPDPYFQQSCFS